MGCRIRGKPERTDIDVSTSLDGDQLTVDLENDVVDGLAVGERETSENARQAKGESAYTDMGKASENISSSVTISEYKSILAVCVWEGWLEGRREGESE